MCASEVCAGMFNYMTPLDKAALRVIRPVSKFGVHVVLAIAIVLGEHVPSQKKLAARGVQDARQVPGTTQQNTLARLALSRRWRWRQRGTTYRTCCTISLTSSKSGSWGEGSGILPSGFATWQECPP